MKKNIDIKINFPKNRLKNRLSDYFFKLSKQNINKSKSIYIERDNISNKIKFYQNLYFAVDNSSNPEEINILVPNKKIFKNRREKNRNFQIFWIYQYKILIGRNQKENQKLVEEAKANDIWMHIRDIPSSHLIIKCDRQNIDKNIIEKAGELLLKLTTKSSGKYEIDYTKRKFVKLKIGSNVVYNQHKTITSIR